MICAHCGGKIDWRSGIAFRQAPEQEYAFIFWHEQHDRFRPRQCYSADPVAMSAWPALVRAVLSRGDHRLASELPW